MLVWPSTPLTVVVAAGYRRALTVDRTQVPSAQTDFPVKVSITDATLKTVANGGHVQSASGYDILFCAEGWVQKATDDFAGHTNLNDLNTNSNWTKNRGVLVYSGTGYIYNNSGGISNAYSYTGVSFASNQYSECTLLEFPNSGGWQAGVSVRLQGSAGTESEYTLTVDGTNLTLNKVIAGTYTNLQSTAKSYADGTKLRLEAVGVGANTRLTAYEDTGSGWVAVWSNIDPGSYIDNGAPGVRGYSTAVGRITDWAGGDRDATTTRLKWEMEFYDPVNGIVVAHVKIASLASLADTVFYMFYGDAAITTDQSDPANTWNSNFKGVWHMADNAASTVIHQSTATAGADAVNVANTSGKTAAGQVGNALTYNGTTDGSSSAINLSTNNLVTISFWVNWTTNANNDKLVFEYTANFNSTNGLLVDWNAASGFFQFGYHNTGGGYTTDHFTRPSAGAWHLVHLVINRSTQINKAYVDGTIQTLTADTHTDAGGNSNCDNSTLYFMSRNKASLFGAGVLDEVRLSTSERAQDWVTCEWNNQKASSTFLATGSEVAL